MAKSSGGTRSSGPSNEPQTFEQQVDTALRDLKGEFFQRMDDYYDNWFEGFEKRYSEWKERDDYIKGAGYDAREQWRREKEMYEGKGLGWGTYNTHFNMGRKLQSEYSDLTGGGYYKEGAKAPNWYAIQRGEAKMSDAGKAVKATAERTAEKKFADIRAKMLKTTVEKGINLSTAKVRSASDSGFLISDGKVTLHARYIMAWGEIKAPHFRFIITDRKS